MGNLTKEWSVYGGVVLMQTETLRSSSPEFVGRRLANIPLDQFNLLSKYKLTEKLEVGGSVTYSSDVFGGYLAEDNNFFHVPAHWRFDALAEYEFNEHLELLLQGINLTNELFRTSNPQARLNRQINLQRLRRTRSILANVV
jgi:catecholate siderophore receptor